MIAVSVSDIGEHGDVSAEPITLSGCGADNGKRFISLRIGNEFSLILNGFDAAAARRAVEIARALNGAAFEILAPVPPPPPPPAPSGDDDIPF
jgi:hypothetical protein